MRGEPAYSPALSRATSGPSLALDRMSGIDMAALFRGRSFDALKMRTGSVSVLNFRSGVVSRHSP
jgi:hypothetical protein